MSPHSRTCLLSACSEQREFLLDRSVNLSLKDFCVDWCSDVQSINGAKLFQIVIDCMLIQCWLVCYSASQPCNTKPNYSVVFLTLIYLYIKDSSEVYREILKLLCCSQINWKYTDCAITLRRIFLCEPRFPNAMIKFVFQIWTIWVLDFWPLFYK